MDTPVVKANVHACLVPIAPSAARLTHHGRPDWVENNLWPDRKQG